MPGRAAGMARVDASLAGVTSNGAGGGQWTRAGRRILHSRSIAASAGARQKIKSCADAESGLASRPVPADLRRLIHTNNRPFAKGAISTLQHVRWRRLSGLRPATAGRERSYGIVTRRSPAPTVALRRASPPRAARAVRRVGSERAPRAAVTGRSAATATDGAVTGVHAAGPPSAAIARRRRQLRPGAIRAGNDAGGSGGQRLETPPIVANGCP